MGSQQSAEMEVGDFLVSTSDSEDASDSETTYAELFQRLIRRYTNSINSCPLEEPFLMGSRRPKIKFKPNTVELNRSEFYRITKLYAGLGDGNCNSSNVTALLCHRQAGRFRNDIFSSATRCKITNNYVPNHMKLFDHYEGKVFCGVFSNDGEYFITASQEQIIRVYKTNNGTYKLIKILNARDVGWSIIDVAFSPKAENFVYSTWSISLHLCPVEGDAEKQEPLCLVNTARRFCVFSLAYSSDGTEILGGANDGVMFIYDLEKHKRTLKISAHDFDVNSVKFADQSSHIIYSGSDDGLIKVWDRRTLGEESNCKPVGVLAGHSDGVTYIDAKGDGRYLISNSKDQSTKLWDVRKFSTEEAASNTLKAANGQTWDYRWQSVPKRLVETSKITGDTSVMTYKGHVITRTLVRCRFSPAATTGQRYIYTGCGTGRLVIYDALTGRIKSDDRRHTACVRDVSWHPHHNEILTSSWDGTIGRWSYTPKMKPEASSVDCCRTLRRSPRIALRMDRKRQEIANN